MFFIVWFGPDLIFISGNFVGLFSGMFWFFSIGFLLLNFKLFKRLVVIWTFTWKGQKMTKQMTKQMTGFYMKCKTMLK